MNETSDNSKTPPKNHTHATIQKKKPIRVGFDLDGVLFFNPLRVVRKPIEVVKKNILRKETMDFYVPKTKLEKLIWKLVHMSSFKPADGWKIIRDLTESGEIEPYLITARFSCLKNDFNRCKTRIKADEYFKQTLHNEHDEQPHLFKEKMVKELGIEYFLEDNWNIVDHLTKKTDAKVLWISNAMDREIVFEEKFDNLKSAMLRLSALVSR